MGLVLIPLETRTENGMGTGDPPKAAPRSHERQGCHEDSTILGKGGDA